MKRRLGIGRTGLLGALLLSGPLTLAGQQGELVGRIVDGSSREPVKAAALQLAGTTHRTTTDSVGAFRFSRLPIARYQLQVQHIGYGAHTIAVEVKPGSAQPIQIAVTATAISMAPLTVEALSLEERRERGTGYRRSIVTRQDIENAQSTNLQFGELLRLAVPTVSVRRLEQMGSPVCIELRTQRAMQRDCLSPAVYLDGVPINSPTHLYDNLDLNMLESMEVVPAAEAGVIYGSGALYGALLITTRRPGVLSADQAKKTIATRSPSFNWRDEGHGHSTARVFALSAMGNGLGLALGVAAAGQCIGLRKPAYDGLISDCAVAPTLGSAAAALLLPAVASGLASRWSGRTARSQGSFAPAAMGAVMTLVPGYALVFSGYRNDSDGLKSVGYGVLLLGAPFVTTAADYLFRELRGKERRS